MTNNTTFFSHIRIIFKNKPYFTCEQRLRELASVLSSVLIDLYGDGEGHYVG